MTKFGYHNGVIDQSYTDVMESIYMMIDHAKLSYSSQRSLEPSLSRQRSPFAVQGIEELQKTPMPPGLLPDNMENIHRPMTALATWQSGRAMPSQIFKSFSNAGPPAKRARISSNFSSLVTSSEASSAQDVSFSPEIGQDVNPKETRQKISNIVGLQNVDHNMSHTGRSTQRKTMISDWLSNINHQEMHNFNGSRRYRETGVWLSTTPEFQHWRDSSQSSLFWLHGARRLSFQIPCATKY